MTFVWVIFMVLMSVTAFYEKSSTDGDERAIFLEVDEIVGLFEIVTDGIIVDGVATDKDVVDGDEAVFAARGELEENVGVLEVFHGV